MKIGIFDPYLDTLGGGERYCFDIARSLVKDHAVEIFWDDPTILTKASERFQMDLTGVRLTPNIWSRSILERHRTLSYDIIFFVSDGSIPWTLSKKTYLILQFPTPWINGSALINAKMRRITGIVCYSEFVKNLVRRNYSRPVRVIAPSVDLTSFKPTSKKNVIISVGRFTTGMNTKKQMTLLEAFKHLFDEGFDDWDLVLAGGMLARDAHFVKRLMKEAADYPVRILPNVSFDELQVLYGKAKIYWHAAGFGEDLDVHPERAEHFGLTTIEAMSAGVVPVVFAGGGQNEIVGNWVSGFLWKDEEEMLNFTRGLMRNAKTLAQMSRAAQLRAQDYSFDAFSMKIRTLIYA